MTSVASDIRINLLANLAGFTGPMDEAGKSAEKSAERFNKAFDSQAAAAARAKKQVDGWAAAMVDVAKGHLDALGAKAGGKGYMDLSSGLGGGASGDKGLEREMRLKDQLPFGKSLRTSISKEAAETAALLGKETDGLRELFAGVGEKLGAAMGMEGMLGTLGSLAAGPLGIATAVAGAAASVHAEGTSFSAERRQRAADARSTAIELGGGVEAASRLNAVGVDPSMGFHLERSLAEGSGGFQELGLNANKLRSEPISQALQEVASAMDNVHDPIVKARAAVEIFGKAGAELLPVLDHLKQKMDGLGSEEVVTPEQAAKAKAADQAKKEAGRQYDEAKGGVLRTLGYGEDAGMQRDRNSAMFWARLTGHGDEVSKKFQDQDEAVAHAAENDDIQQKAAASAAKLAVEHERAAEAARLAAEKMQALADATAALGEKIDGGRFAAANGDHAGEVYSFMRDFDAGKVLLGGGGHQFGHEAEQAGADYLAELKKTDRIAAARKLDPATRAAADPYARFQEQRRGIDEYTAARYGSNPNDPAWGRNRSAMYGNAQEEYLSEVAGKDPLTNFSERFGQLLKAASVASDARIGRAASELAMSTLAAVTDPLATLGENRASQRDALAKMRVQGLGGRADRLQDRMQDSDLAALGVKRPEHEFQKAFQDLTDAAGGWNDQRGRVRQAEEAARTPGGRRDDGRRHRRSRPRPRWPREARRLTRCSWRSQLGGEKDGLQKKANDTLKQIEKNTTPRAGQRRQVLDG